MAASYLLVLGSREGLAWVLKNERMAFREANVSRATRLEPGDRLFLYTTRSCFGSFSRDRGRIIGEAEVATPVQRRSRPVEIGGQSFTHDCQIVVNSLAPFREGLELAPLIPELEVFPDPRAYSARLRRPLLLLSSADARLIQTRLTEYVSSPKETSQGYLDLRVAAATA